MATTVVWTDDGQEWIVDMYDTNTTEATVTWYLGIGTGASGGAAVTDTALGAEVESRVATTDSQPAANQFQALAEITATAARSIDEAGLFQASSGSVMHISSEFDVITLATSDKIEVTFQLTMKDSSE